MTQRRKQEFQNSKKGQQSCGIRKSIQAKWVQESCIKQNVLKQKLKREHHLTEALRNQSNKHQNSQKPMLKAEQKIYHLHA